MEVICQLFNVLLKKALILKQNKKIKKTPLHIACVKMIICQLFNILMKNELILNQKIKNKKLLFIGHVSMVIFQLLNIFLKKVLTSKQKYIQRNSSSLCLCKNDHLPIVQYLIEKGIKSKQKIT